MNNVKNTVKAKIKIKLNMQNGILKGNIIDKPLVVEDVTCKQNNLNFNCAENSQYIAAI